MTDHHHVFPLFTLPIFLAVAWAQTNSTRPDTPTGTAAIVNGVPILMAEVDQRLGQLARGRDERAVRGERAERALEALVQQQLVLDYLTQRSQGASTQEIEREMLRWKERLALREVAPEDIYRQTGMDESAMRRRFAWRVAWPRYVKRHLSEEDLKAFFAQRRRDFDGTQIKVAHILWKLTDSSEESKEAILDEVHRVAAAIQDGKRSFEDAAREMSAGPSAADGGVLGWIGRHGPMHETFTAAAFLLDTNEVSPPVTSPFGIHLIKCLAVQPGTKGWEEVRPEVQEAASRKLFSELARRARKGARIEYTGKLGGDAAPRSARPAAKDAHAHQHDG